MAIIFGMFVSFFEDVSNSTNNYQPGTYYEHLDSSKFNILLSEEMKDLSYLISNYANTKGYDINIEYAGTLEIMEKINNKEQYDAIWSANSIWTYLVDSKNASITNSKATSISPIVFGIKKSKAEELGFVGKTVYTKDLLDAISSGKLKFAMSNPTTTNSGASAYLGMLYTFADNPIVLTEEILEDETVKNKMQTFFSGLERTSGAEDFLEELFLNGDYESVFSYESSIISINKKLIAQGKEPLYLVYPFDGVPISDNPFAYVDRKNDTKLEIFLDIQSYLLSNECKNVLAQHGVRTWYGGTTNNADRRVFNPEWGIDTTKLINPVKYPAIDVIRKALNIYQNVFRKPIHIVFCLDYSGSMYGRGIEGLREAMDYILTSKAEKDNIQFSSGDVIDIILFSDRVLETNSTKNGTQTKALVDVINSRNPNGGTNIYDACISAIRLLEQENTNQRNASVVLMTDGRSNIGSIKDFIKHYYSMNKDIPVYSIMFGEADASQLQSIASVTNGKVFDGKNDLVRAFKEVRGYN